MVHTSAMPRGFRGLLLAFPPPIFWCHWQNAQPWEPKDQQEQSIFFKIKSNLSITKNYWFDQKTDYQIPNSVVPVGSVGNFIFWSFHLLSLIFDLSIFDLLIFLIFKKDWRWSNRSRWSFKKINSRLRQSFKDWSWVNGSHWSLKKIDGSDLIFFTIESIFQSPKTIDTI